MFENLNAEWSLDELYAGFESEGFKRDFEACERESAGLLAFTTDLLKSGKTNTEKIEEYINKTLLINKISEIGNYAHLRTSTNVNDSEALKTLNKVMLMHAETAKPTAMFEKFIAGIEDLDGVIAKSELLKEHEFFLREIKDKSKYLLSEDEEAVLAKMKTTGSDAWEQLRDQLTATLMCEIEIDGKMEKRPLSAIRNMAYSADADLRKRAFEAELKGSASIDKAVAAALNAIKGEVLTVVKMRGYESAVEMTAIQSRMDLGILDALIGSMEDFLPSLRRFFTKKAKMLGHKNGLPWYDLFAPVGELDMRFTYEQGAEFVVKNFSDFSPKLGQFAERAIRERWIDVFPKEGKVGGAFCSNIHSIKQSRVLHNFDGAFGDLTTLAHELGHAYHGDCLKDETSLNADYPMPIAETASTFCETIVTNAAIKGASKEEKLVILENMIGNQLQVIIDIYSRFTFESELFKARANGSLTVEELKEMMLAAQKKAYGEGLDHQVLHPYMWLNKGHYYYAGYNFYNFPYAYGLLFAIGLYAQYLEEGATFIPKYDALLAATGKNNLADVAAKAGIDVRGKEFWSQSLKLIEKNVDEFCAL